VEKINRCERCGVGENRKGCVIRKKKQKIKRMRNHRGLENREGIENSFLFGLGLLLKLFRIGEICLIRIHNSNYVF